MHVLFRSRTHQIQQMFESTLDHFSVYKPQTAKVFLITQNIFIIMSIIIVEQKESAFKILFS